MSRALYFIVGAFVAATPLAAQPSNAPATQTAVVPTRGKMVVDSNGTRLAPVNRITADGSVQIVFEGRLVTIPASTLSITDGKLTSSMTKAEVLALR